MEHPDVNVRVQTEHEERAGQPCLDRQSRDPSLSEWLAPDPVAHRFSVEDLAERRMFSRRAPEQGREATDCFTQPLRISRKKVSPHG